MPFARPATAAIVIAAAAGCGAGADPVPVLMELVPLAAYNEAPIAATIHGQAFRPAYRFDAVSGSASVTTGGYGASLAGAGTTEQAHLESVAWESVEALAAEIPAGLPAGSYDLMVTDPAGQISRLPAAFTSFGPNLLGPVVTINSPSTGATVAAGAQVPVVVAAQDGLVDGVAYGQLGQLSVSVTAGGAPVPVAACALPGGASASCAFTFRAPPPAPSGASTVVIDATAVGSGGQLGEARASLALVPAPTLATVTPSVGSTLGGQTVTLTGTGFLSGATAVAFDGAPAPVVAQSGTTLTVTTPPRTLPGPVTVSVTLGGVTTAQADAFRYVAPPSVRELDPASGGAAGLFPIVVVGQSFAAGTTQILFGGRPLLCARFVNPNRIEGLAPPGVGTEPVTAIDAIAGGTPGVSVPFDYIGAPPPAPSADGGADASPIPDAACPAGDGGA